MQAKSAQSLLVCLRHGSAHAKEMAADKEYPDGPDDTGERYANSLYWMCFCSGMRTAPITLTEMPNTLHRY